MASSIKAIGAGGAGKGGGEGILSAASQKQAKEYFDRIKPLFEQRAEVNEEIAEVFKEAGEAGLDTKILRKAVKLAMADHAKREAEQQMVDSYLHAIQPDLFSPRAAA